MDRQHSEPTTMRSRMPTKPPAAPKSTGPAPNTLARDHAQGSFFRRITTNMSSHFKSRKAEGEPSVAQSLVAVAKCSWLNLLLLCIPVSWALHFAWAHNTTHVQDTLIFVFSFFAIIPLAKLLAFATEELSIRVGQTIGGLLNATLGNAVELIVAIIALTKCELQVVQSSLVGSILSNLLLVLGMCFFAGGTRFSEQGFLASAAQLNSSLLVLSVIAVLLPAAFHFALSPTQAQNGSTVDPITNGKEGLDILKMSRGVAVILLFIYGGYLVFQLCTHADLYANGDSSDFKSTRYPKKHRHSREKASDPERGDAQSHTDAPLSATSEHPPAGGELSTTTANGGALSDGTQPSPAPSVTEEPEVATLNLPVALGLLAVVTILVAVTADWLVDSIGGLTATGNISQEWVGLILLPIVGNAAEHVTAVTVSVKDKLTLSLGVAVGSSIQIALFVIPFLVVLAWILGRPLTLLFDPFQSVVLFLAVLTVNYAVADGKSNWLEGMILMALYVIIAVSFWFYPGSNPSAQLLNGHGCFDPSVASG